MSELRVLDGLQAVDTALDRARAELEQVLGQLGESAEVAAARPALDQLRRQLTEEQTAALDLELQIQQHTQRIADDEKKLYGGQIRSPKELDDLQRSVEGTKHQRAGAEDRLLAQMERIEQTRAAEATAEVELARLTRAWETSQSELVTRRDALRSQAADLEQQRSQLAAQLGAATLAIYEDLRRNRRGVAVARVERNTCLGCRLALPVSIVNQVRLGRGLTRCPTCGRILVSVR
ncbi:MAG: hypothetical protein HYY04_13460 [Chloroflexi bacterium]|nr:hypothetical protein [Chloroflexota bacterium]